MDIRHKVPVEGGGDSEGPDAVPQGLPNVDVEHLLHGRAAASTPGVLVRAGHQRRVGEASQHEDEHEDAKDTHGVLQSHLLQQTREEQGQGDCEGAGAGRHDAVDQAQAFLEVVAQDDQAGLVGEGTAGGKHDAVGEVEGAQGPGGTGGTVRGRKRRRISRGM